MFLWALINWLVLMLNRCQSVDASQNDVLTGIAPKLARVTRYLRPCPGSFSGRASSWTRMNVSAPLEVCRGAVEGVSVALAKQVTLVAAKALPLASVRTAGTENEPRTRRLRALNFVSVVSDCRSMDSLIRKYRDASKHRA